MPGQEEEQASQAARLMNSLVALPRIDTLLLCASITTVGLYACAIWERSLRAQQHRLYIDAAIRVLDVMWNPASPPRLLPPRARASRAE